MEARTFVSRNVGTALPDILADLHSAPIVPTRLGPARERLSVTITLERPDERFHVLPHRNANPFAQVYESLWVLTGRRDIGRLSAYLPRAREFSDDGETWRAAYGPRLRAWPGTNYLPDAGTPSDQLERVRDELVRHPQSRRAVVSLWDPLLDWPDATKDIPCNNWLHFLIRDGALHLNVATRSNDVWWGWSGINAFEWSVIQEVLAVDLGVAVGPMTFFISSLHLYERHWKRADALVTDPVTGVSSRALYDDSRTRARISLGLDDFTERADALLNWEEAGDTSVPFAVRDDPFLRDAHRLLRAHLRYESGVPPTLLVEDLAALREASDLTVVAYEWFQRTPPDPSSSPSPSATPGPDRTRADAGAVAGAVAAAPDADGLAFVLPTIDRLHAQKTRAYGDSWKKHGELFSILPNIARKVDRLERLRTDPDAATLDETALDTAIDLFVYAVKYVGWLHEQRPTVLHWPAGFYDTAANIALYAIRASGDETDERGDRATWDADSAFTQVDNSFGMLKLLATGRRPQPGDKIASALDLASAAFQLVWIYVSVLPREWAAFAERVAAEDERQAVR